MQVPEKADGLVRCLGSSLHELGIENALDQASVLGADGSRPILVGGGTDGASVNIAKQNGMKAKMQREIPWLFWAWCYAHRLELACADALISPLFKELSEMLLRLYHIYANSPKKSRELHVAEIVTDLKEVFSFPDSGDAPVRSQGSCWIAHKRKALQRVVDQFGAYIGHLSALVADHSVNGSDRARLKGYLKKWSQSKFLVGAALYVDVLKAPSLLSLSLQENDLDVVMGIKHILKSVKALKNAAQQDPSE